MPYSSNLSDCCKTSFDGRGNMALDRSVGIDVDFQVMNGANWQHRGIVYTDHYGRDEMLVPRRRAPEHLNFREVEQEPICPHPR